MKPEYPVTQPFGANYNSSYAKDGLKGHTGVDYSGGYGSPIHAIWGNEYVYKILTVDNPANDGSGYTAVFCIVENNGEVFEFTYGHGDPKVVVGQVLQKGDLVMTEANHGEVFSGGVQITLDMQKAGDKRGSHVHGQKRPLRLDTTVQPSTFYLSDQNGKFYNYKGYYCAVPLIKNGYSGCVDWLTDNSDGKKLFLAMQQAILNFQLHENITDFNGKPLESVVYGPKTIAATKKYL